MRTEQEIRDRIKRLEEFRELTLADERMAYDLGNAIRDMQWVLEDSEEGS